MLHLKLAGNECTEAYACGDSVLLADVKTSRRQQASRSRTVSVPIAVIMMLVILRDTKNTLEEHY